MMSSRKPPPMRTGRRATAARNKMDAWERLDPSIAPPDFGWEQPQPRIKADWRRLTPEGLLVAEYRQAGQKGLARKGDKVIVYDLERDFECEAIILKADVIAKLLWLYLTPEEDGNEDLHGTA